MNLIRSIMSALLLALLLLSIAGWIWAGGQPSPRSEGARVALALCGVMSLGTIALLWSQKQDAGTERQPAD